MLQLLLTSCLCVSSWCFLKYLNPPPAKRLGLTEGSDDDYDFSAIKYFLIKVRTLFFRHNAVVTLIDYSVNIAFICTENQKVHVTHIILIFTFLQWSNWTHNISLTLHLYFISNYYCNFKLFIEEDLCLFVHNVYPFIDLHICKDLFWVKMYMTMFISFLTHIMKESRNEYPQNILAL